MKKTKEEKLVDRVEERFPNNEFEYISGFTVMAEKCKFRCNNCGNKDYQVAPSVLLDKRRATNTCSECRDNNPELGKNNFYNKMPKDFLIIGEYVNNKTPVTVKHECGHTFDFKPNNLSLQETVSRCPRCNLSGAERVVADYLDNLGISYTTQQTFDSCRNSRVLPFDFYLPDMNLLMEVDGKQHHGMSWGDEAEFERIQITDKIKENWAKDNGITMIRLPALNYGVGKVRVFMLDDVFLDGYFPRDLNVINEEHFINV